LLIEEGLITEQKFIAGSRESKDPQTYDAVFNIIKGVYWTDKIKEQDQGPEKTEDDAGKSETIEEVVKFLITELSLNDKAAIAKMSENDLFNLNYSLEL